MPGRILIVDDVATNRLIVRAKLAAHYYDVIEAASGEEAIALAAREQPDLVLLDVLMPGLDGFDTCRRLKEAPASMHIPVMMLTALDGQADRLRGLEAGADEFLTRPFPDMALLARVASLVRMKLMVDELRLRHETFRLLGLAGAIPDPRPRLEETTVLLVSGCDGLCATASREIRARIGCAVERVGGETGAREVIAARRHDACIIGPRLADGEPLRVASLLRARPETRRTPVMMIVPPDRLPQAQLAMEMGVADYVTDPSDVAELTARLRVQLRRKTYSDRLRSAVDDTLALAVIDPLTGLYNRRYAENHLGSLLLRQETGGQGLAAMMLDLDRFKAINDAHGHAAGDAVLRAFASRLRASLRGADLVVRAGGEEFLAVMPDIAPADAESVAERARAAVESAPFSPPGLAVPVRVTVSIGLAFHRPGDTAPALLARADKALYASKSAGRNVVTLATAA